MIRVIKNLFTKLVLLFLLVNITINSFAQDSSHIRISLLTCTPGEELYSTFGHSAFRVIDSTSMTDIVYNYGTFDFDDASFYLKFVRGKLLYYVSAEYFKDFKYLYQSTNRGITEQVLNLSAVEKLNIYHALLENLKEENKYYKYDFFLDNCTTRLRDILLKYKQSQIKLYLVMPQETRFRQAIHEYLDKNNKDWSKLGIDILLGQPTDAVMTTLQTQFLPDNLMKTFDTSNVNNDLVISTQSLYTIHKEANQSSFFTPINVFSILFLLVVLLSVSKNQFIQKILLGFDGMLFFLTGLLGIILILMWVATDHAMCQNNFNLLWAWPTHIFIALFANSKKRWVKRYFGVTALLSTLLLVAWYFLPQQMNNALIPVVLLLIYRSVTKYLMPLKGNK